MPGSRRRRRRKTDQTRRLPDELLREVFSYLPHRDKLRVESVSRRFQRCVMKLLQQPYPMDLKDHFEGFGSGPHLNTVAIRSGHVSDALRSVAKKSKFSDIRISLWWGWRKMVEHMDALLSILLETECLDKVVSLYLDYGPSPEILEKFLAQCDKLTSVNLYFVIGNTSNILLISLATCQQPTVVNLSSALTDKALTQLHLRLIGYTQEQLVGMFHSLKPQTLRKLSLVFYQAPMLDVAALVRELGAGALSALREINLCWGGVAHVHLAEFFDSLVLLPQLQKCYIRLCGVKDIQPRNQFVAAMTALFKSSVKITLESSGWLSEFRQLPRCQMLARIRQVQNVHRNLRVDFVRYERRLFPTLSLSLGNGLVAEAISPGASCADVHCVDCHRFYPAVLSELENVAGATVNAHLEDYQLEKCRIETVADHLNKCSRSSRALFAQLNEAQDLVTITFETTRPPIHQFNITVATGQCFSSSCIRCIHI